MEQHLRLSNLVDPINKNFSKLDGSLYVQLIFFPQITQIYADSTTIKNLR
jgi:hypothetical protein